MASSQTKSAKLRRRRERRSGDPLADHAVDRGSEIRMMTTIPPLKAHGIEIRSLEDLRKEIAENRRELRLAQSQLPQLEQVVEQARLADTRAGVQARRAGKNDPGPKNEQKAQAELDKVRREVAVLQGLDAQLASEGQEILGKHAEEITQKVRATLSEVNESQLAAIAEVEASRARRGQLSNVLAQVAALAPQPEPQAEAGDYVEVLVHHAGDSIRRVDEGQIQKVLACLRAEAGDTGQRDQLAAMESPVADVFHLGAGALPVPEGKIFYEQRKAERTASAADTTGG
jgi:hypothetical protein